MGQKGESQLTARCGSLWFAVGEILQVPIKNLLDLLQTLPQAIQNLISTSKYVSVLRLEKSYLKILNDVYSRRCHCKKVMVPRQLIERCKGLAAVSACCVSVYLCGHCQCLDQGSCPIDHASSSLTRNIPAVYVSLLSAQLAVFSDMDMRRSVYDIAVKGMRWRYYDRDIRQHSCMMLFQHA